MVEIIVNVVFPGCLNKFNNPSNKLVQTGLKVRRFPLLEKLEHKYLLKTRDDAYKVTKNSYGN